MWRKIEVGARTPEWERDPLDHVSGPTTKWTVVNAREAMPGTQTPLSWTFFGITCEEAFWLSHHDKGVLSTREVRATKDIEHVMSTTFRGQYSMNLISLGDIADATPGSSRSEVEAMIMGRMPEGANRKPPRVYLRYPVALLRMTFTAIRVPRRLRALRASTDSWWKQSTRKKIDSLVAAEELFDESVAHLKVVMRQHANNIFVTGTLYNRLRLAAAAAGLPGAEAVIGTAGGDLEEVRLSETLTKVARGEIALEAFLADYGFHGPDAGNIHVHSWRDDPSPVASLVDKHKRVEQSSNRSEGLQEHRADLITKLLAATPAHKRPQIRALIRSTSLYVQQRELGKGAYLQAIDVGRYAARHIGRFLVEEGTLRNSEDVFFLTRDELISRKLPDDVADLIAFRKERYETYAAMPRLPEWWQGNPPGAATEESGTAEAVRDGDTVSGLGVSPGVVEGLARVMHDPGDEIEPGEIIVCASTDPSWVSVFTLCSGLVIDVGGPLSHGAIIAREMGLPCIVNTAVGTTTILSGDKVVLDAEAGTATVVSRVTESSV
jgi:pyruvate,water dikinase